MGRTLARRARAAMVIRLGSRTPSSGRAFRRRAGARDGGFRRFDDALRVAVVALAAVAWPLAVPLVPARLG
jgi:hypothetical protein